MADRFLVTDAPPLEPAHLVDDFGPSLLDVAEHSLCPGCGEPIALRAILEAVAEVGAASRTIGVIGIGCYTAFAGSLDIEVLQALHGRAPSLATGAQRAKPENLVITLQGDGDLVNEGLQEVLHTAARGEAVTAILLNNGVFGETGGHMTATSVIGQRTKNTLDGMLLRNEVIRPLTKDPDIYSSGITNDAYVMISRTISPRFAESLPGSRKPETTARINASRS